MDPRQGQWIDNNDLSTCAVHENATRHTHSDGTRVLQLSFAKAPAQAGVDVFSRFLLEVYGSDRSEFQASQYSSP